MSGTLQFNREFAEFGPQVRNFEKADDVGFVVTELLWDGGAPFYAIGELMDARINATPLGEGDPASEELIDLVLRFPTRGEGDGFWFEIVLRVEGGAAYAGWIFGEELAVTDEIVNGHRVLEASAGGTTLRYVYDLMSGRYSLDPTAVNLATADARRIAKRRR
ncbi:hypothetical protein [uncultured Tateyamaria sp.]|uniref:hypothetical protein n=1 Tax=uncultured Tateyamaria sp. TaxID=455651 RepID=UPI00261DA545|nr:hypothetical protein [uncultured Tateyamaria sp.]